MGPLIAESEARRLKDWIDEAVQGGARLVVGGQQRGAFLGTLSSVVMPWAPLVVTLRVGTPDATILERVPSTCQLEQEEAFGYDGWLRSCGDCVCGLMPACLVQSARSRGLVTSKRCWIGSTIQDTVCRRASSRAISRRPSTLLKIFMWFASLLLRLPPR